MKTLQVSLGDRSYPIYIGSGLLGKPDLFKPHIAGQSIYVVSNTTVAPLYSKKLIQTISRDAKSVHEIILLPYRKSLMSCFLRGPTERASSLP